MQFLPHAPPDDPDAVRMTIGEHLDELRAVVLRSMFALLIAAALCIWPSRYLYIIIARPLIQALHEFNQPTSLLATDPTEPLLIYIKVVLIIALVLSAPYILVQAWSFVAAGLYRHERAWVQKLVPFSVGLFLAGVAFMYFFMLPTALRFLIGFSSWMPMPDLGTFGAPPAAITSSAPSSQRLPADYPPIPLVSADPADAAPGRVYFNTSERKLKVVGESETYSLAFQEDRKTPLITTHIRISEYLWFVLVLTIAFGLAFQMPLVVIFLVRSRIMRVETLRKQRKLVIMAIVITAGMIAPPDLMSHLLLSFPMILLFELGLWIAARPTSPIQPAG